MTDRPINLTDWQVRAALDGRLSLVVEPVTISGHRTFSEFGPSDTKGYDWHFRDDKMLWHDLTQFELEARLQRHIRDRLWVREAWRPREGYGAWDLLVDYAADGATHHLDSDLDVGDWRFPKAAKTGNVSPLFMPRWASRLTLTVTDVRVQRLQDISEGDAIAEGIEPYSGIDPDCCGYLNYLNNSEDGWWLAPIQSFRTLWNSINGPEAWDADPWVTATTVTVHRSNIDQMEGHHEGS